MKIQLKSDEDLTIVTKGGGNIIVPNNTDTSTDKTLATVDQIGPVGGDKANAASIAAPYETDHSSAYVVGDYVTHEGTLYKCKSDTSNPPGEWDDNNWDPVAVTDEKVSKSGDTMTGGLTVPNLTVGERKRFSTVGTYSVANGLFTTASGESSHAEGDGTTASGESSHAEGVSTTASGVASHAEGSYTTASGESSHAEGGATTASGTYSHAEGGATTAGGNYSHAEGGSTTAGGRYSHAEGGSTTAQNTAEHAQGQFNASHTGSTDAEKTIHSIGVGTANNARTNAVEVMRDGKVFVKGVGGYDGTNPTTATNLATTVAGKVDKSGDTMTGALTVPGTVANAPGLKVIGMNSESVQIGAGDGEGYAVFSDGSAHSVSIGAGGPAEFNVVDGDDDFDVALPKNTGTLALQEGIAAAFSASSTYEVGAYCTHEGLLYKCTTAVSTAGAWDSTKWTAVAVMSEATGGAPKNVWYGTCTTLGTSSIKVATTTSGNFVAAKGNVVIVKFSYASSTGMKLNVDGTGVYNIKAAGSNIGEGYWTSNEVRTFVFDGSAYVLADYAKASTSNFGVVQLSDTVSSNKSYAATPSAVNTRAPKESPEFTGTPKAPTAAAGTNTKQIATTAFVQTAVGSKADDSSLAPAFSDSLTYAVGDYCTHEGLLYKCSTAVTTAGAWNAADWTAVAVTDEMAPVIPPVITVDGIRLHGRDGRDYLLYVDSYGHLTLEPEGQPQWTQDEDGGVSTDGELNEDGTLTVDGELNEDGTLTVQAGSGPEPDPGTHGEMNNDGSVTIQGSVENDGTLSVTGDFNEDGTFTVKCQ